MWVTKLTAVSFLSVKTGLLKTWGFIHKFSHSFISLNSPLTWGYSTFPQLNAVVTTTTYNYMKTPVRFPFFNLNQNVYLKIKTCKVIQLREG